MNFPIFFPARRPNNPLILIEFLIGIEPDLKTVPLAEWFLRRKGGRPLLQTDAESPPD